MNPLDQFINEALADADVDVNRATAAGTPTSSRSSRRRPGPRRPPPGPARRPPTTVPPAVDGRIVVVGLGPAGPDLVTAGTLAALADVPPATCARPATRLRPWPRGAPSFDDVYESATTSTGLRHHRRERLVAAAEEHGEVVYAVPGSPVVAERTVELLVEAEGSGEVALDLRPALQSFVDLACGPAAGRPHRRRGALVDRPAPPVEAAGERGPLLVAQCDRSTCSPT